MKTSTVVLVLGLAAVGGVGFYLYKKSQAAPADDSNSFWSGVSDVISGVGSIADSWGRQSSGSQPDAASASRPRGPLILTSSAQSSRGVV